MKNSDGFTLIELLVGILCAALVTGAAVTLMLMGVRSNRALLDANSEQQTVRIITSMVESLASEGKIRAIYIGEDVTENLEPVYGSRDWAIMGSRLQTPVLSYSSSDQTIFTSESDPLMTNITSSTLDVFDAELGGFLLTLTIRIGTNDYAITTYCRTVNYEDLFPN